MSSLFNGSRNENVVLLRTTSEERDGRKERGKLGREKEGIRGNEKERQEIEGGILQRDGKERVGEEER
jgi:hypothetical protein